MYTITSGGVKPEDAVLCEYAMYLKNEENGETRFVASFDSEDTMDFFIGLILSQPYSRRERLWEVSK